VTNLPSLELSATPFRFKKVRRSQLSCRMERAVVICPKVALPTVALGGFMFTMLKRVRSFGPGTSMQTVPNFEIRKTAGPQF